MFHPGTLLVYTMYLTYLLLVVGLPVLIFTRFVIGMTVSERNEAQKPEIVTVEGIQGRIVGTVTPQAGMLRGIPFSQPPTGEYRWKNPRPSMKFPQRIWNATYVRPGCPQTCTYRSQKYTCPDETDEDCLYLNVWVPRGIFEIADKDDVIQEKHYVIPNKYQNADDESLAVMVFIHGGNFLTGAGSARIYDGRYIAEQGNVIVVSINFRLGALGFLVHGDGEDAATGNYGMLDQINALKWVQENIKFFGGNPNKITLFGQSSGAESIGILMTSPAGAGLFHRSIMSSNPLSVPLRYVRSAKDFGAKFVNAIGCSTGNIMTCLRKASVSDIVKASKVQGWSLFGPGRKMLALQPWGPVIDGKFLSETPLEAFKNGNAAKIPVVLGGTADEGMFFVSTIFPSPVANFVYQFTMGTLLSDISSRVLEKYPVKKQCNGQPCDNRVSISKIVTDYIFICPERSTISSTGSESWFYVFNQPLPFQDLWDSDLCYDKVCHCADLPFVFNTVGLSSYQFSENERLLAKRMAYFWTNFAKYGNPNGEGEFTNNSEDREERSHGEYNATYWPRFSEESYSTYSAIELKSSGDSILSDPYQGICDFWDELDSYGKFR